MKAPMLKFRQCAIYYVGRISDRKGRDTNMYRIVRKEALGLDDLLHLGGSHNGVTGRENTVDGDRKSVV